MAGEDEERLRRRFVELAEKSYRQGVYLFTGFLGLSEQEVFYRAAREFSHVPFALSGGHAFCERVMARFGDAEMMGYEEGFPIVCLEVRAAAPKFAEELHHRDYLGALVNLGIERSVLGDIFVAERAAYVYVQEGMAAFVCENLGRVRHTAVACERVGGAPPEALPRLEEQSVNVASERLDVVVSAVYRLSRSQGVELFQAGRVFVGGRLCENNSAQLREGEIVSVRGFGRFVYEGVAHGTRKGRLAVRVKLYK